ncbi:hypothetical protein K3495_g234 [Podosphaera aphanis]|nr:hypothetical protein K3495_g234 [Podosphaera aphanis]
MSDTGEVSLHSQKNQNTNLFIHERTIPMDKISNCEAQVQEMRLDTPTSEQPDVLDGSNFFDLRPPLPLENDETKIEELMKRLFSEEHLHSILSDYTYSQRFSSFLNRYRPHLVPTLLRYIQMRKAMKAIEYANAVARSINWSSNTDICKFSRMQAAQSDVRFEDYAKREVQILTSEALPAWVTFLLVSVVTDCVTRDITGQSLPIVKDLIGNLGEVFCLTDPKIKDNPIIYCSEEFYRTTQYGTNFAINRNCRFLQGPHTNLNSKERLKKAIALGQESNEVLLNYRRDGTPFANLLMVSPLYDDKGVVRYFIGAQVDVTGLIQDGLGLDSFRNLLHKYQPQVPPSSSSHLDLTQSPYRKNNSTRDVESLATLIDLSQMLSQEESDIVTKNVRSPSPPPLETESVTSDGCSMRSMLPTNKISRPNRRIIDAGDSDLNIRQMSLNGDAVPSRSILGVYRHYLLIRPYPSLQIIFASPSLRLPGLLRTPLFTKIGGSPTVLSSLEDAFRDGASVTARILWLPKHGYPSSGKARRRWIRCTPLLGSDDRVGVWMVVLVPADSEDDIGRPLTDSGYHSLGAPPSMLGVGAFGNGRQAPFEQMFDDFDDLAAMESLVEGRRSSVPESNGSNVRSRRVTILDHDDDSLTQGSERAPRITTKKIADEGLYSQFLRNANCGTSIIQEEI